jgi:hypothetical protein
MDDDALAGARSAIGRHDDGAVIGGDYDDAPALLVAPRNGHEAAENSPTTT